MSDRDVASGVVRSGEWVCCGPNLETRERSGFGARSSKKSDFGTRQDHCSAMVALFDTA